MGCKTEMMLLWIVLLLFSVSIGVSQAADGYIRQKNMTWILGTSSVERVISFANGKLYTESIKSKATGQELLPQGVVSDEFEFAAAPDASPIIATSGDWSFVKAENKKLALGELQLSISVKRDQLQVTKNYVVYPGSSVIREWIAFKNVGSSPVKVANPSFLNFTAKTGDLSGTDFMWMTGGENQPGSWKMKTEVLSTEKQRRFDSNEPFKADPSDVKLQGDGVNGKIFLNGKQVWPKSGWAYSSDAQSPAPFDFTINVAKGDTLAFLVNCNKDYGFDTTAYDPTIAYSDGETHTASREFSDEQGKSGWRYQYVADGQYCDMDYDSLAAKWRMPGSNDTPWISAGEAHPHNGPIDTVRVWTAPKSGSVHVTGIICNTANGIGIGTYGHRAGSGTYAPWYAIYNKNTHQGIFIGWDYFGHWTSSFTSDSNSTVTAKLTVAGYNGTLAPGESFETPKSFVGLYNDDLDNAGNECLDWQYKYLWDYTREPWFPAIRMQGYWNKGTGWGRSWIGGGADFASTFRKIFRVTDLLSYCGGDVYHRDWGWWDVAGDWNGPDFRATHDYLKKHGMNQLIYAFLYTVDGANSRVGKEHPEWLVGGSMLNMAKPEVVEFMKGQLDTFYKNWADFEWRNDSGFTSPINGDETPLLGQDQGFRKVMQDFLDKHPDCAFQGVNGGGNYGGYDYTRFSSSFSFSDGAVGILRNYYAALLLPPDKTSDIPESTPAFGYDKATYRGKLCMNFDIYGDTWETAKLEGLREIIDIYHYLQKYDVVGRWVKVYRPIITGDDPTMYFQRLSGNQKYGIIIPKQQAKNAVNIKPKGLIPDMKYVVNFQESEVAETRTGADLMKNGISIDNMAAGELIYLNLPLHPGSKLDNEAPSAPSSIKKNRGENMGYPGVEISWKAARDNNWISYYDIYRNGKHIDRVAKGTFYFDHSAGADVTAKYEVCAVDGAGNTSAKSAAAGPSAKRANVYDDTELTLTGDWKNQKNLQPAYEGTISFTNSKGASADLNFEGSRLLIFAKLGAECGKAFISIDGGPLEIFDTYSADDIWGACVYNKKLDSAGPHKLHIEVLGVHGSMATDSLVNLDGIRAENE